MLLVISYVTMIFVFSVVISLLQASACLKETGIYYYIYARQFGFPLSTFGHYLAMKIDSLNSFVNKSCMTVKMCQESFQSNGSEYYPSCMRSLVHEQRSPNGSMSLLLHSLLT